MTSSPTAWKSGRLGELLELLVDHRGKTPGKLGGDFKEAGVPVISAIHIKNGRVDFSQRYRYVDFEMFERWMPQRLRKGDVLLTSEAPLGAIAEVPDDSPLVLSQRLFALRAKSQILDNRYLRWALEAPQVRGQILDRSSGSTVTGIRQSELINVLLPLPPIAEQRRIVEILEDHLSRLDAANSMLEADLIRVQSLHRANLHSVISEPDRPMVPLAQLVRSIEAGRSFGSSAPPAGPDEWGIIRVSAMTWGTFRPNENKRVPAVGVDARFEIRPGDLLVSRANTSAYVGASVLVRDVRPRLLLSDKSLRLVTTDGVRREWLQLALSAPRSRAQISALATGTKDSMRNISQAALLSITVPAIDEDVQVQDLERLGRLAEAERRLRLTLERCRAATEGMRRSLLAAAFSGKLTGHRSDTDRIEELAGV